MKLKYYEIDEKKLLEATGNDKKISIKMPEGFINYSTTIIQFFRNNGIEAKFIADPCYGACDFLAPPKEKTICIGEAEMPYLKKVYRNVSFVEAKYNFNLKFLNGLPELNKRIGLASITPFIHKIEQIKKFLEKQGKKVYIGKKSRRTKYDGQILGCDFSSATSIANMVDEFLFIGDGFFHPLGLAIATKKKVIAANPISRQIESMDKMKEKMMKQRYAAISLAIDKKKIGIIIGEKLGQRRVELAKKLKKLAEKNGMEAYLIMADNITPIIDYIDVDFFVSTACPRVAIDDAKNFKKPMLTPIEFEILIGERDWNNYEFDQIL